MCLQHLQTRFDWTCVGDRQTHHTKDKCVVGAGGVAGERAFQVQIAWRPGSSSGRGRDRVVDTAYLCNM